MSNLSTETLKQIEKLERKIKAAEIALTDAASKNDFWGQFEAQQTITASRWNIRQCRIKDLESKRKGNQ